MELRLAATMDALLLRTLDCSGLDLLPSDDSSLGFTADLGEAWFFFERLSSSLSSNSSLKSTVMRQDLSPPDFSTWIAFVGSIEGSSSSDESVWWPTTVFNFLDDAPDF